VEGDGAVGALVALLRDIDPGRPSRIVLGAGHYASVLALDDRTGIALCTDGVGTKVLIAQAVGRFDTVGIDCVAMNVNDIICVGAEPIALVDYVAVEKADPAVMRAIGAGLRAGAERAGIEIPGGEVAELPEILQGHPSPLGFDLAASCVGTVALDNLITGASIEPGDIVIGLPSSGIHSNGLTLAREALLKRGGFSLDESPPPLERPIADELLEPTEIYVPAILELVRSGLRVTGLAHITGDGWLNLLRLNETVGYRIDDPLPSHSIFDLIQRAGDVRDPEMHEIFNMGTGFCAMLAAEDIEDALRVLTPHYPDARPIGAVTDERGCVRIPPRGIAGRAGGFAEG
jgi:phosphoribosylformylglycinamidine cyclo-ligase